MFSVVTWCMSVYAMAKATKKTIHRRSGVKFIGSLRKGERFIAWIPFKKEILILTSRNLYRLEDRLSGTRLVPIKIEQPGGKNETQK